MTVRHTEYVESEKPSRTCTNAYAFKIPQTCSRVFTYTAATFITQAPLTLSTHFIFFAFYERVLFLEHFSLLRARSVYGIDHFLLAFVDQRLYLLECGVYLIKAVLFGRFQPLQLPADPVLSLRQLKEVERLNWT